MEKKMDNSKVLALRIDEKLQREIKEYLAKQRKTLKDYVTELITEDLQKNATIEMAKEEKEVDKSQIEKNKNEIVNAKSIAENKIYTVKEEEKSAIELKVSLDKKQVEKGKEKNNVSENQKQELKKTVIEKKDSKKTATKKKQKEDEEEFEQRRV